MRISEMRSKFLKILRIKTLCFEQSKKQSTDAIFLFVYLVWMRYFYESIHFLE